MSKISLLPVLLFAALLGATPALAEEAGGWKVMQPVATTPVKATSLESAAEAALPPAGGGAGTVPGLSTAAAAALADETAVTAEVPAPTAPVVVPTAVATEKPAGPAYLAEDQPFKLKEYEEPKRGETQPWWQVMLGFCVKLVIVLGLIFGSLVAVKKISGGKLPGGLSLGTKGRNLVVLESTSLGNQAGMHLVSVGGGRVIVIGTSPQGVSTLATIDDPHQVQALLATSRGQNTTFGQAYDMESVAQEPDGDLYHGAIRDVSRRGWGS